MYCRISVCYLVTGVIINVRYFFLYHIWRPGGGGVWRVGGRGGRGVTITTSGVHLSRHGLQTVSRQRPRISREAFTLQPRYSTPDCKVFLQAEDQCAE